MKDGQKIPDLLARIEKLSGQIDNFNEEIHLLKQAVSDLQKSNLPINPIDRYETKTRKGKTFPGFENFIGLKLINFVGIIVLMAGLAIGVKYAIDIHLISPAVRIVLTYIAATGLLLTSLKLRKKYELFSLLLFGGAMASAYFTTYAAFEYYALLSRAMAFILMLIFTVYTVYNSLKYNRQEIAILGLVGAYGIPFFVRGNTENVMALFSYIFFINCGVLLISLKKYWLSLSYISFFTTWVVYLSWLLMYSAKNGFEEGAFFCYAFFIFFILNSLLFKAAKRMKLEPTDTIILVADTVLFYFSLIVIYKGERPNYPEDITLYFGIIYLLSATGLKIWLPSQQHLYNGLFSVALTALLAFAGLKFESFTLTIVWVIMAVLIFVAGIIFKIKLFRISSMLIFAVTILKLLFIDSTHFSSVEKVIAYLFIGLVLLVISFLYQKFKDSIFGTTDFSQ